MAGYSFKCTGRMTSVLFVQDLVMQYLLHHDNITSTSEHQTNSGAWTFLTRIWHQHMC
jgi:hypothetical protein